MKQILKLAMRNLKEHKAKTIIIATFIILGSAIVILGNAFLESVNRGLEKDFRANYTGDLVIGIDPEPGILIDIFNATSNKITTSMPQIPALPHLEEAQQILDDMDVAKSQTKLISGKVILMQYGEEADLSAIITNDDLSLTDLPVSILFAGEESTYFETFPDLHILEGTYPEPDSDQIMVDERIHSGFEKTFGKKLNVGDKVLLIGSNSKTTIREATVCAFFNPANEYTAMFKNIYATPNMARAFADLTYSSSTDYLGDAIDTGLGSMDEDDLFGDDFDITEDDGTLISADQIDFDDLLGDTTLRDMLNQADDGAWNFIVCKLKHPSDADKVVAELNRTFNQKEMNVRAMNWHGAALSYTSSVEGIGTIFNILIIILAVVVFIIIMNTMTVSVIERTSEIGTMRAIGAEKKFVRRLFFVESVIITVGSAVIGAILAVIIGVIFNSCNITLTNDIAKMILGGGELHFSITAPIVILTILVATLGSVLSNIYPVRSALKITPLKALSKGGA